MKSGLLTMCVAILIFTCIGGAGAAVYHVSNSGADAASGSSSSPWRTLSKANSAAVAGDVVIVHGGQYTDGIHPANSGAPGNPITFQVAPGEHAVLATSAGVQLTAGQHDIVVDGFEIHATFRVVDVQGASYITIRNCVCYGGRETYQSFDLNNCSYCIVQNNYLDRQDPDASTGGGDGLVVQGKSHNNLIEGNTVIRCEHVGFSSPYSGQTYNVWRNNRAYYNHTNYALFDGVERCVFEGNIGYYQGLVWTGGSGNCLQFTGSNCIIRFNTLYDDTATAYPYRQWPAVVGSGTGSANGLLPSVLYNKIYNNTIYGESDQTEWAKSGWRIDNYSLDMVQNDNNFKNNIFAAAPDAQVEDIDNVRPLSTMHNRYEGNLLSGSKGQPATVLYFFSGNHDRMTVDQLKASRPDQWAASNKEGNPLFVNTIGQGPAKDFSLSAGSPAIDAGVALTTASAGATGSTTLLVADAGYFIDGWGIPGVVGDSVKIEGNAPVGISRVDYATNTITLNSPCSWAQGAGVYYYRSDRFQGNAPDIGAHEYGSGSVVRASPPSVPLLAAPSNGSTQTSGSVAFAWGAAPGATSYWLQVGSDNSFSSVTSDQKGLSATGVALGGFSSGTVYYWRVSASNSAGTSAWSTIRSFTAGADPSVGRNILNNSDFDAGTSAWTFYTSGQGAMQQGSPGYDDGQAVEMAITQSGSNTQLYQVNIALEVNARYRLSFAAFSNSGHGMDVVMQQHDSPYANYGLSTHFALSTSWALYTVDFTSATTTSVSDGRLMFWLGPYVANGDQYWVDRIVLEKLGSASVASNDTKPVSFLLQQNYPNPFNPTTAISSQLPEASHVRLIVYDALGRQVAVLADEQRAAGTYKDTFDGKGFSSGIYYYRLTAGSFTETKKMVLMK